MSNWKEYSKTLPIAKEIYVSLFGEPKTHEEWAERFNKIGTINNHLYEREIRTTEV